MKKYLFIFVIAFLASITGCATTEELQRVQGKFESDTKSLKEENAAIRKDFEKSMTTLRKTLADTGADISDIKEDMQSLKGEREVMGKDVSTLKAQLPRDNEEYKGIKNRLDDISSRLSYIETLLDIKKKEAQSAGGGKESQVDSSSALTGKTDKDSLYASAYETFKEGKYDKARTEFKNFLIQYPNTEYSDHAQFWIGECYYFEKKYEEAILEYDKVAKSYPKGEKVPSALLKEGFAFLMLGDKTSARAILQQVIKDYPNTSQERMARAKLNEIK
ncbi:MAG TPA: tol-pal system protein YbgF [Syntrophales bacterium]|nr:tol-pal system protein YbgF [Syntrophales bacterium]